MAGSGAPRDPRSKILDRAELLRRYARPRDVRVVFTNGCFDLLHRGHVEVLGGARALGDVLVVGLNSDASVRRLKGAQRPLVDQDDRALVLASLEAVDAVTVFDEDTPRALISELLPDLLVKGGDYRTEDIVGREEVEEAGGAVRVLPLVDGRSSTALARKLEGDG